MKGSKHPTNDATINGSGNESIVDLIDRVDQSRRTFLKTTLSASVLAAVSGITSLTMVRELQAAPILPNAGAGFAGIDFESLPAKIRTAAPGVFPVFADTVEVSPGYSVEPLVCWGDPIAPGGPAWAEDASQDAAAQEKQFGTHTDGMHYFPFPSRGVGGPPSNTRGLLCVNHEYTHEEIIHGSDGLIGTQGTTIQKVRKSQTCHGVSVVELRRNAAGKWAVASTSPFGRRITGNTPMRFTGPAAGHPLLKSKKYDITPTGSVDTGTLNDGFTAFGTLNNCAHGYTPWGTYLTCEENWNGYFGSSSTVTQTNDERRYGVTAGGFGYRWHVADDRFDIRKNQNEPFHFGWTVEIDPFDPTSTPVKHTLLGRIKHESAQVAIGPNGEVGYYQGDDERNEYIYKFVAEGRYNPANRAANKRLLESGTLYVAKFTDTAGANAGTFRGVWIPLVPDQDTVIDDPLVPGRKLKLREVNNFAAPTDAEVQALILIRTRMAADAVGATMMDRPEWTALRTYWNPGSNTPYYDYNADRPLEGYCTLTNNNRRGGGNTVNVANPNPPPATIPVPAPSPSLSSNSPLGTTAAGGARPPVDVANPRPNNIYGHIIRWREDGNTPTALTFDWDIFVLAGDTLHTFTLGTNYSAANFIGTTPADPDFNKKIFEGNIVDVPGGSADYGAPDGLWFDNYGRMWIQTDQQGDAGGDFRNIGANSLSCADPVTRETRRFMTSPPNCEVTGVVSTPDGTAMFVGIQHPGEDSLAADPDQFSAWPGSQYSQTAGGVPIPNTPAIRRPRSSVLVITRNKGGVIGGTDGTPAADSVPPVDASARV